MNCNKIGDEGAAALADGFERSSRCETLDLNRNTIGNAGAASLSQLIASPDTNVMRRLMLVGNKIGDEGARYLAEAIKASKSLSKLNIQYNSLSEASKTLLKNAKSKKLEIVF